VTNDDRARGAGEALPHDLQQQLDELTNKLGEILGGGMGQRSKWALNSAHDASKTDGITGMLVIKIPSRSKDHVDISFTCGLVEVVSRWS
jgi:hypothetical protein